VLVGRRQPLTKPSARTKPIDAAAYQSDTSIVTTNLRITWDGTAPGLPEHRLSLGAFESALRELLGAIRRIATDLERDAWPTHKVGRAGRLTKTASNLDLQIRTIRANSPITLDMDVVEIDPPQQRPLIEDLGERSVARFLDGLKLEAKGTVAHYRVRKYLRSLPEGVTRQTYVQRRQDGSTVIEVDLGEVHLREQAQVATSHLIQVIGEIIGVGFEPARNEVKVRAFSGEAVTLSASSEQVSEAIAMRGSEVACLGVVDHNGRMRLLRLGGAPERLLDAAARAEYVFNRWNGVLTRLAQ
jgi:hypothetical protein